MAARAAKQNTVVYYTHAPSPWGAMLLLSDGEALTHLQLPDSRHPLHVQPHWRQREDLPLFKTACRELAAYFAGRLRHFTIPLSLAGTGFQARVWRELARVPYGHAIAYSALAEKIGAPAAVRAVAMANARNPLPIIIPCHRIIGKNGALTGYSGGGVTRKAALLRLEGVAG